MDKDSMQYLGHNVYHAISHIYLTTNFYFFTF